MNLLSARLCKVKGYTLLELIVTMGVAGVFLAMFASLTVSGSRSLALLDEYLLTHSQVREASDVISREVRNAVRLTEFNTNRITLMTSNDVTRATNTLTLYYRPEQKELVSLVPGKSPEVLIDHCESFRFSIYQRTPLSGTYDQFPAASVDTCKLVQMDWVAVRKVLGVKSSETVQSAKIVIRNAKRTVFH